MPDFSMEAIFKQTVAAMQYNADIRNADSAAGYALSWENSNRNWVEQRRKFPPIAPPLKINFDIDWENYKCVVVLGPDRVCEAKPMPWDIIVEEEEPPVVEFGPAIYHMTYGIVYAALRSSAEDGHQATHPQTGQLCVLRKFGVPGMINYYAFWLPIQ